MSPPGPPPDLARRMPLMETLAAGTELHRFYTAALEPINFDRSRNGRFNAPDERYGVLYVAASLEGAFAETFLRTPGATQIAGDLIARKAYVRVRASASLRLVMLHGVGLARLGATAEVAHSGLPYDIPQAWSARLHGHPAEAHGIAYRSRHDDDQVCYAIFNRAASLFTEVERVTNLDTDWFYLLAERYSVGLAP